MRVLHVESGRHLYGGALQVRLLLEALGEGTHILACSRDGALADAAEGVAAKVYRLPVGGELDLNFVPRLYRIIRRERIDLIHLHSRRGADLLGGIAGRLAGLPVVLSRRVDHRDRAVSLKYRLYDRVITISEGIRRVLLEQGVPASKLVLVHSAVDTRRYRPGGNRTWLQREFGLAAKDRTVGMIAQFIERKGHKVLLDAIPAILARHPNTRFLLFGQGPLSRQIDAEVHHRGLAARVQQVGFRDDLERIIPVLDLVVHPAYREGLGVSLLQAAACAIPIVASRTGGIPEIVHHGNNGLLVEPGNSADLATACNAVLDDPNRASAMGRAGVALVHREYSTATMAAGNLRVYLELLDKRR